ncbi:MAG: S8 family peptidase [Chthoniobacterales bacterium]
MKSFNSFLKLNKKILTFFISTFLLLGSCGLFSHEVRHDQHVHVPKIASPVSLPSVITSTLSHKKDLSAAYVSKKMAQLPSEFPAPLSTLPAPLKELSKIEESEFPGARVLEFAELEGLQPDQKIRARILETHLKDPYVRIEEMIDVKTGGLLSRLEMVADKLLVTLPKGSNPEAFLKQFGAQGLCMLPVNASLSIYRVVLRDTALSALPSALNHMNEIYFNGAIGEPDYIIHSTAQPSSFGYHYQWALWKNNNFPSRDLMAFCDDGPYRFMKDLDMIPEQYGSSYEDSVPEIKSEFPEDSDNASWGDALDAFTTHHGINAEDAWNIRTSSSSVTVAVLDTGIDYTHDGIKDNMWQNADQICDSAGRIGTHGWNFISENDDPMDRVGHGTHVAGIIGAKNDPDLAVSGVSWQVQLMACRIFTDFGGTGANGIESDFIKACDYAKQHGATLLNCSLEFSAADFPQSTLVELQDLRDSGIIVVAAAGNHGTDEDRAANKMYPVAFSTQLDNVVSVAATDYVGKKSHYDPNPIPGESLAFFSNYGAKTISLAAPGVNILSTYTNHGMMTACKRHVHSAIKDDNNYLFMDGTSMAAPFVTGALALMKAQFPNANYKQLIDHLLATTDHLPSLEGKIKGGRLNVGRALNTPIE